MNLTAFLLARIAEDEAEARRMLAMYPGAAEHRMRPVVNKADMSVSVGAAVLLAECQAKRRIVELADEATGLDVNLDGEFGVGGPQNPRDTDAHPYLGDRILRALVLPYADHPDYREEWP